MILKLFNLKFNMMKKTEKPELRFIEMNREELTVINGGNFAYDLGRFIRYMGVYYANGTGVTGILSANADFFANIAINS
jgi:hypothetical protein